MRAKRLTEAVCIGSGPLILLWQRRVNYTCCDSCLSYLNPFPPCICTGTSLNSYSRRKLLSRLVHRTQFVEMDWETLSSAPISPWYEPPRTYPQTFSSGICPVDASPTECDDKALERT